MFKCTNIEGCVMPIQINDFSHNKPYCFHRFTNECSVEYQHSHDDDDSKVIFHLCDPILSKISFIGHDINGHYQRSPPLPMEEYSQRTSKILAKMISLKNIFSISPFPPFIFCSHHHELPFCRLPPPLPQPRLP